MASPTVPAETAAHYRGLQQRSSKARSVNAVERRIRELVDTAPPLTDAQRDRLVQLLRRGTGRADS